MIIEIRIAEQDSIYIDLILFYLSYPWINNTCLREIT